MYHHVSVDISASTYSFWIKEGCSPLTWKHNIPLASLDLSRDSIFEALAFDKDLRILEIMANPPAWSATDPGLHDLPQEMTSNLCDMLRHNTTLTNLTLTIVNISAVESIVKSLGHNTRLTSLSLSNIFAGGPSGEPDGLGSILQSLSLDTTLRSLDLRWCNLASHVPSIVELVTINSTLTALDLSCNKLILDPTLAHALCYNTTLTSIDLSKNCGTVRVDELSKVMRYNGTLTSCHFDIPSDLYGLGRIADGLRHNSSLNQLGGGVGWKGERHIEIKSYLQRNTDNQIKRNQSLYEILFVRFLL